MVLPRLVLELRRHEQHLRAHDHQPSIELGEPNVVADRQAEPGGIGLVRHQLVAGGERRRLTERRLTREVDVVEMDLPILATSSPSRSSRTDVAYRWSSDDSMTLPPSTHIPRARAIAARRSVVGPGTGSAAAARPAAEPRYVNTSGSAARSASRRRLHGAGVRQGRRSPPRLRPGTHLTQGDAHGGECRCREEERSFRVFGASGVDPLGSRDGEPRSSQLDLAAWRRSRSTSRRPRGERARKRRPRP